MAQRVDDWDFNFPQVPSDALPTDVFSAARTMTVSSSTLALKHHLLLTPTAIFPALGSKRTNSPIVARRLFRDAEKG